MTDPYWRYTEAWQPTTQQLTPIIRKRSRSDCDVSSGHDLPNYYPCEDDGGALRAIRDTKYIEGSCDHYLQIEPISPYSGAHSSRLNSGMRGHPVDDPQLVGTENMDPGPLVKDRTVGILDGKPDVQFPPNAASTLFVFGLPPDCRRREVAHIFRPFCGYKEVRLVNKEPRRPGGNSSVLCFVDFLSPAHAATAMDALQGYKFDEDDRNAVYLRLEFARYPGARSGGAHNGKH